MTELYVYCVTKRDVSAPLHAICVRVRRPLQPPGSMPEAHATHEAASRVHPSQRLADTVDVPACLLHFTGVEAPATTEQSVTISPAMLAPALEDVPCCSGTRARQCHGRPRRGRQALRAPSPRLERLIELGRRTRQPAAPRGEQRCGCGRYALSTPSHQPWRLEDASAVYTSRPSSWQAAVG